MLTVECPHFLEGKRGTCGCHMRGRLWSALNDLGGKAEYLLWVHNETTRGTQVLRAMTELMRERLDLQQTEAYGVEP